MKIRNVNVRVSPVSLAVFGAFTLILLIYAGLSGDYGILVWGLPMALLLLIIPMALPFFTSETLPGNCSIASTGKTQISISKTGQKKDLLSSRPLC